MEGSSVVSRTFSVFQRAALTELNFLRTCPAEYAEQRLREDMRAGTDNGAYRDILDRSPVGPLKLDRPLCTAAAEYAQLLAERDRWGHYADETPRERARRAGYHAYGGENVAAGSSSSLDADTDPIRAARVFILRLTINEGVPSVSHRTNMLRDNYRVVGIGFARFSGSTYTNYMVQDFGLR